MRAEQLSCVYQAIGGSGQNRTQSAYTRLICNANNALLQETSWLKSGLKEM